MYPTPGMRYGMCINLASGGGYVYTSTAHRVEKRQNISSNNRPLKVTISEEMHIRNLREGNLRSFEAVFREYYELLCRYACKLTGNAGTAEELVQDLFYTLWDKRQHLQIDSSLKSYLYTATHNRCLKHMEHQNVRNKYRDKVRDHREGTEPGPQERMQADELQVMINQTLDSMPERCSKIFRLNRFEGMKYSQIAEMLAISVKTVEANMGKALRILRRNLRDYVKTT